MYIAATKHGKSATFSCRARVRSLGVVAQAAGVRHAKCGPRLQRIPSGPGRKEEWRSYHLQMIALNNKVYYNL